MLVSEPVQQRRRDPRAGQDRPHPAAPLCALHRRRREPVQLVGVEVLPIRHADDGSLEVVRPSCATGR